MARGLIFDFDVIIGAYVAGLLTAVWAIWVMRRRP